MSENKSDSSPLELVARIVSAYVAKNSLPADELPQLIRTVNDALQNSQPTESRRPEPAVPINKSVKPNYVVCLEDGRKLKMLKRHLKTAYDMSPDEYRKRWDLSPDYPMVAPKYAAVRSELAKKIGLGRKRRKRSRATQN